MFLVGTNKVTCICLTAFMILFLSRRFQAIPRMSHGIHRDVLLDHRIIQCIHSPLTIIRGLRLMPLIVPVPGLLLVFLGPLPLLPASCCPALETLPAAPASHQHSHQRSPAQGRRSSSHLQMDGPGNDFSLESDPMREVS